MVLAVALGQHQQHVQSQSSTREFSNMTQHPDSSSADRLLIISGHVCPANPVYEKRCNGVIHQQQTSHGGSGAWAHVSQAPPDKILGITENFKVDTSTKKLNLGVGAYRTEEGEPLVLEVVKKAELKMVMDPKPNKEYLGIAGDPSLCKLSRELAFGKTCPKVVQGAIATVQCLSGTGSLRNYPSRVIYLPTPTWANHNAIFRESGLEIRQYKYYHSQTKALDIQGLLQDLRDGEQGAIVLFHACAHNPTGVDPTMEQWEDILQVVKKTQMLPFFDSAYQGFASGDLDADAAAIRLFANSGMEMLLAQSYSKNLGLYGERTGCLSVVCRSKDESKRVESQLKTVIRPMYSNPPRHGAAIVSAVLGSPELFSQWKMELKGMSGRIQQMRKLLHGALSQRRTPGDWSHIINQIGMFTYTGLTPKQVEHMTRKWHIYMTLDGRISMAGLSSKTCAHLADAMDDAVRTITS